MRALVSVSVIGASLVWSGCAGSSRPLDDRMFDHFGRSGQIQTALIVGDLESARRPASWLAEHEDFAGLPQGSESWVDAIRASARGVARAGSIDQAAEAAGRLAAACAGCHRAVDDGPQFRWIVDPPESESRVTHMMRHLWAMDRMWEGLIAGSTEVWAAGADALADAPPERDFPGGAETAALALRVHEGAAEARAATESERPALYAEMIRTCAACHTRLGIGRR